MKRGLVLSLCAAAVVAMTAPAFAVVNAQLNLRYNDPADPSEGGTWELLVQSTVAGGLAGIDAQIDDATGVTGISNGGVTAGAFDAPNVFEYRPEGAGIEVVAGDDLTVPGILTGVGTVGGPSDQGADDLANAIWDNSALIASGTFGATRPSLTVEGVNEFDAADDTADAVLASTGTVSTRGDGVGGGLDGLFAGDVDRSFNIDSTDLNLVLANFNTSPDSWDLGDVNDDGNTNSDDLNLVLASFNTSQQPGPAISAVPEPSTAILTSLLLAGLSVVRGRRS